MTVVVLGLWAPLASAQAPLNGTTKADARADARAPVKPHLEAPVKAPVKADASVEAKDGERAEAGRFTFAVFGSATTDGDRETPKLLRAIDDGPARFVVHFDLSEPSPASCADAAGDRRRRLLDASAKPVVPVAGAAQWADCGNQRSDPLERLESLGETLFASDESLGRTRLPWLRQSALARFHRYRENVRWQVGRVLFVTINLPNNNNNFRVAAGRNSEFEERVGANRAWLERAFRIAAERHLAGVVIFVDAAPGFRKPMPLPDLQLRDRDGYYEWKLALREFVPSFKGQVLLVQARYAATVARPDGPDQPLRDVTGKPIPNFVRTALPAGGATRWLRVAVDPGTRDVFGLSIETLFDDPSGELYGMRTAP